MQDSIIQKRKQEKSKTDYSKEEKEKEKINDDDDYLPETSIQYFGYQFKKVSNKMMIFLRKLLEELKELTRSFHYEHIIQIIMFFEALLNLSILCLTLCARWIYDTQKWNYEIKMYGLVMYGMLDCWPSSWFFMRFVSLVVFEVISYLAWQHGIIKIKEIYVIPALILRSTMFFTLGVAIINIGCPSFSQLMEHIYLMLVLFTRFIYQVGYKV
uniref:Uncharacterized protein n=1 Tax=Metapenaeus joyneri majanivirus TaxID=2984280 RepID=A0A9C7BZW1_9VIRU|nr:MAG: hypothetical protein [Metapenaeus joyneri majanivirus]